jgi:ATP-binding cassette subfamily F protein uup
MSLIRLRSIQVSFGGPAVLDNISLSIDNGERVCLLGRNGTGKSTLMKVISGQVKPDSGEIERQQNLVVATLQQEVSAGIEGTVFDVVADGLGESARILQDYHRAIHRLSIEHTSQAEAELERTQHAVEVADAWKLNQQVEAMLSKMDLDGDAEFSSLSGGMKRRVSLAQALVQQPDLLLLDEPTNHLDLSAISWLEEQLLSFKGALLFVTHDRSFLRKIATRIVDLDRGELKSYPGDYDNFLRRKDEFLKAEAEANAQFDKKLAQEEVWIRQGIKARRTRNEGRVRALKQLREQRKQRRELQGTASMKIAEADRSGKLVTEVTEVGFNYEGDPLIKDFNTTIMRGDRIGIIGPNGAGKTTLLQILLGNLKPQQGKVKTGTNIKVAYFDQMKAQLDENASAIDNVAHGRERIDINGQSTHVVGYLQNFLFSPERARAPIKSLSGGERSRLLLARLFSQPANILVLDEPTNDLDIETLELLEELILEFSGTVLLVSHDREFLNNVATSTLVFEGNGHVAEYVGGYDDWVRQRTIDPFTSNKDNAVSTKKEKTAKETKQKTIKAAKLSYKDQRELDSLPERIELLENTVEQLQAEMATPEFFQQDRQMILDKQEQLATAAEELEHCYSRWEILESG